MFDKYSKFIKSHKRLLNIILSYFLVISIPIIIIYFFFYPRINQMIEDDMIKDSHNIMQQVQVVIDDQIKRLNSIPIQLIQDEEIKPLKFNNSIINQINTQKQLQKYFSSNSFIHNAFLYFEGSNVMISYKDIYQLHEFNDKYYYYENWSYDDFHNDMHTNYKINIRAAENVHLSQIYTVSDPSKLITLLLPLANSKNHYIGSLLVMIDEKTIQKSISSITENGSFIILDNSENIISYINRSDSINTDDIMAVIYGFEESDTVIQEINNQNYVISLIKSEYMGWTYVSLVPLDEVVEDINYYKNLFAITLLSIVALGIFLIFLSAYWSYLPLRKLKQLAMERSNDLPENIGEMQLVADVINHLANSQANLSQTIHNNKLAVKQFVLLKLINGKIDDIKKADINIEESELLFQNNYYACGSMLYKKSKDFVLDDLILLIENCSLGNLKVHVKIGNEENRLILVMVSNAMDRELLSNRQNFIF